MVHHITTLYTSDLHNVTCQLYLNKAGKIVNIQFSSVAQSCLTLCGPADCSAPGLPVHHQLPEPAQTHVLRVGDATQPSRLLFSLLLLPSVFPGIMNISSPENRMQLFHGQLLLVCRHMFFYFDLVSLDLLVAILV